MSLRAIALPFGRDIVVSSEGDVVANLIQIDIAEFKGGDIDIESYQEEALK